MSFVVIRYTGYSTVFDRLSARTNFEEGLPDTRKKIWPLTFDLIREKPLLGHGPRMPQTSGKIVAIKGSTGRVLKHYPHSLYLFILYTLGIFGLAAYSCFGLQIYRRLLRARSKLTNDKFLDGLPKLGIIILSVFLIDQVTFEFLRFRLSDYQHYIYMLLAAFVGISDLVWKRSTYPTSSE
jgi:O-antigen ligase